MTDETTASPAPGKRGRRQAVSKEPVMAAPTDDTALTEAPVTEPSAPPEPATTTPDPALFEQAPDLAPPAPTEPAIPSEPEPEPAPEPSLTLGENAALIAALEQQAASVPTVTIVESAPEPVVEEAAPVEEEPFYSPQTLAEMQAGRDYLSRHKK